MFPLKVITALLLSVLVFLSATNTAEATYRKPPGLNLNGSIFGKRGNGENSLYWDITFLYYTK